MKEDQYYEFKAYLAMIALLIVLAQISIVGSLIGLGMFVLFNGALLWRKK